MSSQGFAPCKREANLHPLERYFLLNAGSAAKLLLWSFTGTVSRLPSLSIQPLRTDCSHCSIWITVAEKTAPNIFVHFMLIHFVFAAFCLLSEAASASKQNSESNSSVLMRSAGVLLIPSLWSVCSYFLHYY